MLQQPHWTKESKSHTMLLTENGVNNTIWKKDTKTSTIEINRHGGGGDCDCGGGWRLTVDTTSSFRWVGVGRPNATTAER